MEHNNKVITQERGNGELEPSSLLVINYVESYLVYVASLKKASRRCVHLRNSGLSI